MATNALSPLNDLVVTTVIRGPNATTGTYEAVTTGTVTGFLATSDAADATTADASWQVTGTYVGGNDDGNGGTYDAGTWLFHIDAAALTAALLATHFATATPWFIVTRANAMRRTMRLRYVSRTLEAAVEP